MAFDGFITKSVITELNNTIIGAKVNKVYEPTKNDVVLSLYNNGNNYLLDLCANPEFCRICLTTHSKQNPQNAYNFCMLLRKYLVGGKIIKISNYDLERTIEIQFECYNDLNDLVKRKLFVEIMSRQSNIILTNENNIIIDTLKHVESGTRELLPAHEFEFTAINKESFLKLNSFEEFYNIFSASEETTLSKIMPSQLIGFSKTFILNTLKQLNISDIDYSRNDLEKLYNYIKEIIANFGTSKISCVKYENDYCLSLTQNENPLNINFFIDDFYYNKESSNNFTSSRNNLLRIISGSLKKVSKKLENINNKLKECSHMDTYKLYGELLTANLYKFKNAPNMDKIELENYYDNNNLITIPLDKSMSIHKNIDKYFKKYNKLKNTLEIVSKQKADATKELDYLESIIYELENATSTLELEEIDVEISEHVLFKNTQKNSTVKKNKVNKRKNPTEAGIVNE